MKYNYKRSDRIIAYLTLISGLVISAVAVWYSVAGLVSIFAASAISIIIMGVALEVSKLVATVWLKWNWIRAPWLIKIYLISAIAILMIITSMGIFGYLSKAHLDQNIVSGDVQARILIADEKIKIERENIANAQQVIKQMDAAVNGVISSGDQEIKLRDGSTQIRNAAERSLQIRRSQAKDREMLTRQIEEAQTRIVKLQEESAPVRAEMRKVEAEVGPIKYIAKLIYGDQTDQNMLEKSVTWVIIIIVLVFDPLAVVLLLSSQYSFQWFKQEEQKDESVRENISLADAEHKLSSPLESNVEIANESSKEQLQQYSEHISRNNDAEEANKKISEIEPKKTDLIVSKEATFNDFGITLEEWNELDDKKAARALEEKKEQEDNEILSNTHAEEKAAMSAWKADNPNDSLKRHKKLLENGVIQKLPWGEYLKAKPDNEEDMAAIEAAKWAQEQLDKKTETVYMEKIGKEQIKKIGYKQNEEQSEKTLWQRVKDIKNDQ